MTQYGVRDVERALGLSRTIIQSLVRAGFVTPTRGPRNAYRFSFQDLIVLKTARELSLAQIPSRRIAQALKRLRRCLPVDMPLSGLRIMADGDQVVVREGDRRWHAHSGQYLLDLEITPDERGVKIALHRDDARLRTADAMFDEASRIEESDASTAIDLYRRALSVDPAHSPAAANLGRLLHLEHRLDEAEHAYRAGIARCGPEPMLLFNLAVLLEDMGRPEEARESYEAALEAHPDFADAHYNLGALYESLDERQKALRHLRCYRNLMSK